MLTFFVQVSTQMGMSRSIVQGRDSWQETRQKKLRCEIVASFCLGVLDDVGIRIRVDFSVAVAVFHREFLEPSSNGIPMAK